MSNPSGSNEGDKRDQTGKTFPINLAAKVAVKSPDGSKSSLILGTQPLRTLNPQMRVLTHAVAPSGSSISTSSTTGQTIISTIVPQTMLKQAYHVPRGPAAVANLAVPRGTTPIRGITLSHQTATVRQLAPPRTPSPGNVIQTATSWPAGTTLQVQSGVIGTNKGIVQNPLLVTQPRLTTAVPLMQGRANVVTRTTPLTATGPRPATAVLHSTVGSAAQIQAYKPGVPMQSLGQSLTVSQVGVTKAVVPQTLVYTTVTSAQHLTPTSRLNVTTTPQRQLTTNRTVSMPTTNVSSRPGTQAGQTILTTGKLAAVVVSNTNQAVAFSQNPTVGGPKLLTHPSHGGTIQIAQVQAVSATTAAGNAAAAKLTAQLQQHHHQQTTIIGSTGQSTATVLPVTVTPTNRSKQPRKTMDMKKSISPVETQISSSGQPLRFGQIFVDRSGFAAATEGTIIQSPSEQTQVSSVGKQTSSPRPSILRKRENDSSSLKAAKNLTPVLATLSTTCLPPVSPPSRPDSRGTGQSSAGSTTISATSSPGPDESPSPPTTVNPSVLSRTDDCEDSRPPIEMSPRKKPRKQQLTGNDIQEPKFDIQFLSERIKEVPREQSMPVERSVPRGPPEVTVKKPVPASLLNGYHQTWKSTHNHFMRYTDVKPKEERALSIVDIANQKRILQKINGWKIYHLTTQMEDLSDFEMQVHSKLTHMLQTMEAKDSSGRDKDLERINDLIKGNMQRSKIINDGMLEAKSQVMKIFDHKVHAVDIINRCASKRNYKKREKS